MTPPLWFVIGSETQSEANPYTVFLWQLLLVQK